MSFNVADLKWRASDAYAPDKGSTWSHPVEKDGWMLAHNAIRGEISDVKSALTEWAKRGSTLQWEIEAMRALWSQHALHVRSHHSNEEAKMNPFLASRIKLPEKLETDHEALIQQMEKLDALIGAVRDGEPALDVNNLLSAWTEYESMMLPHLAEEELVALPLMRAYFEPKEIGPVVQDIVAKGPPVEMGSFIYYAGDDKFFEFMKQEGIPGFVWYIDFKGKRDGFKRDVIQRCEALRNGLKPIPPRNMFSCC